MGIVPIIAFFILFGLVMAFTDMPRRTMMAIALPLGILALIPVMAVSVKRLHDRNKSGWWMVIFYFLPKGLKSATNEISEPIQLIWGMLILSSALGLWGLIELGFLRGTEGPNQYGEDPLGGSKSAGDKPPGTEWAG